MCQDLQLLDRDSKLRLERTSATPLIPADNDGVATPPSIRPTLTNETRLVISEPHAHLSSVTSVYLSQGRRGTTGLVMAEGFARLGVLLVLGFLGLHAAAALETCPDYVATHGESRDVR